MGKIYIHLLSDFDAVFKFVYDGQNIISVNSLESLNEFIDLEITYPSDFEIYVYPIIKKGQKLFSYGAKFKCEDNNILSENDYVKVYKLPESHFIVKFSPFLIKKQEIIGDKLEINDMEIKKLSFLNDLAGRAKVEILKVDDTKITKEKEYFVYLDDSIENETNPEFILLAFFEAYIASDFNTCFTYLSDSYGANLDKDGLKEFFGEIVSCLLVNYYNCPSVVLFYEDRAVVYSANVQEGKISDIYELN